MSVFDICCLTETWLKESSDMNDALHLTASHQMHRRDRPLIGATIAHGDVAVYVRDLFHVLHR